MTVAASTRAKPGDLLTEHLHYTVIRFLAGNEFNAIKYLYDRLNIIDAKASTLLRFNALFVTALVFVLGVLRAAGTETLHTPLEQGLFWGGFILLGSSTIFTFLMFGLQFDNITVLSNELCRRLRVKCEKQCTDPPTCALEKVCELRRLGDEMAMLGGPVVPRELEQYEEEFFKITVNRQRKLNGALLLTKWAGAYFALLLMLVAWHLRAGDALLQAVGHLVNLSCQY